MSLGIAATALACAVLGAGVPVTLYLRALGPGCAFLLAGAVVMSISVDWNGGPRLGWNAEAVRDAALASSRAFASLCVTLMLACTVSVPRWLAMLRALRVTEPLLDLLLLSYRTLFVLDEARTAIVRAQHNRLGYASVRAGRRSAALAFAGLFLRSLEQARRMERGLAARNYQGRLCVLQEPSMTTRWHLAAALGLPVLLAVLALTLF